MNTTTLSSADRTALFSELARLFADEMASTGQPVHIPFPRGFIRTIESLRARWPYLSRDRQRTVACFLQLADVNRFQLNLWQVGLTAGTMWEWHCTVPVVAVIEALLKQYLVQYANLSPKVNFAGAIDEGKKHGVFGAALQAHLHELRGYRNQVHIDCVKASIGNHDGSRTRYNEAVRALGLLESRITAHYAANTGG